MKAVSGGGSPSLCAKNAKITKYVLYIFPESAKMIWHIANTYSADKGKE